MGTTFPFCLQSPEVFNERGEIKSYTGVEAGGYLDKLENTYDLVYRYRPISRVRTAAM